MPTKGTCEPPTIPQGCRPTAWTQWATDWEKIMKFYVKNSFAKSPNVLILSIICFWVILPINFKVFDKLLSLFPTQWVVISLGAFPDDRPTISGQWQSIIQCLRILKNRSRHCKCLYWYKCEDKFSRCSKCHEKFPNVWEFFDIEKMPKIASSLFKEKI